MSRQSDIRWSLIQWAVSHGHNLDDCTSLVDAIEYRTDAINYAESEAEKREAVEDYEDMKKTVKIIFDKVTTA